MRYLGFVSCAVLALGMGTPRAAGAAPLLVVVESADRTGPDAAAIRRSIGVELGTSVVAPASADPDRPSDVLLVALDRSTIRMSLRTSTTAVVTRTIDASPDSAARIREIAWLAGNLARDQVGALVATPMPAERPVSVETPAVEAAPSHEATEPSAIAPAPPSSPDAVTAPDILPTQPAAIASAASSREVTPLHPVWSLTAAGGPTVTFLNNGAGYFKDQFATASTYQLEVAHQAGPGGLILGAALDVGSGSENPGSYLIGLAGFTGTGSRRGRWLFEATAGVGLELGYAATVSGGSDGQGGHFVQYGTATRPFLYLRGTGVVGFGLSSNLDLLLGATFHVASEGLFAHFAGATVGLRCRLP